MVVFRPPDSSGAKNAAAVLIGFHPPISTPPVGTMNASGVARPMGSITRTKLPFELAHSVRAATGPDPGAPDHGRSVKPWASLFAAVIKPLVGAGSPISSMRTSATSLAVNGTLIDGPLRTQLESKRNMCTFVETTGA